MSKRKKRLLLAILLIVITATVISIVFASTSFAIEPSVELYQKWNLQKSDMMWSFLRKLGWGILMFFSKIVNAVEFMFSESIRFLSFGLSDNINNFIADNINPFIAVLLGIGLTFFGIAIMLLNVERNKLVINFMLLLVALFGLPLIMTHFTDITMSAMETFSTGNNVTSENEKPLATASIFLQNVIDFRYLDENNFSQDLKRNNNLKQYSYIGINIDETIEPNSNLKNSDVFKKEATTNASGELEVRDVDFGGWLGIGAAYYYRYNFDFVSILLMLLSSFFVFIFLSFKTLRLAFEIAFGRVLAIVISPVDITSGAKTRKLLMEILTLFISLIFVAILYRFFLLGSNYISTTFPNPFVRAIFILFLALIVIDGPNLVEKIMGVDIGVRSAAGSIISFLYGVNTAKNMMSGIGHMGSNLLGKFSGDKNNESSSSSSSDNIYHQGDNESSDTNNVLSSSNDSNSSENVSNKSSGPSDGVPYSGKMSAQQPVPDSVTNSVYSQNSDGISSSYNTDVGSTQDNNSVYTGDTGNEEAIYESANTQEGSLENRDTSEGVYSDNSPDSPTGHASESNTANSMHSDDIGSKPYSQDNKSADIPSGGKEASQQSINTPAQNYDPKSQIQYSSTGMEQNPKIHYGNTSSVSSPMTNNASPVTHSNSSSTAATSTSNADSNIYSSDKENKGV